MGKDSDNKKDRDRDSKKDSKKRDRSVDRDKDRDEDREKRKDKKDNKREKDKEREKARSRSRDKHRTTDRDSDRKSSRHDDRDRNRDIDKRGRSRSRERDEKRRSDGKSRHTSRSERRHHRSISRSRSSSKSSNEDKPTKKSKADVAATSQPAAAASTAAPGSGSQLTEEELQKRRERVRLWQEAKAKSAGAGAGAGVDIQTSIDESTKAADPTPIEEPTISLDDYIPLRLKLAAAAAAAAAEEENNMATDDNQPPDSEEAAEQPTAESEEKPVGWSLEDEDDDEIDAADKANISELTVGTASLDQYETQLPLVSEQTLTAAAPGSTPTAAVAAKGAEEEAASSVFSAGGLRKKKKISRWENSDPITPTAAASTKKPPAPVVQATVSQPLDDVDPLDEFMSGLYSGGDVETQKELVPKTTSASSSSSAAASAMPPPSSKAVSVQPSPVAEEEFDEGKIFYGSSSKLNPFGTNYITMEDILGSSGTGGDLTDPATNGSAPSSSSSASKRRKPSGWESDALGDDEDAMDTGSDKLWQFGQGDELSALVETEEEREAREEREKQEFIDAIRKAREEEEAARQKLRELDSLRASEAATAAAKKETMGRVFAGEGDIVDEVEVLEKKKSALELLEEAKRGKMLKEIDHSKIEYMPFRKNLYIVPKALSKLTELEAQEKREDLHIKVRGREPFPIQKQAIPAIMCGRDVIGVAKTGSGKTLAFLLPMFRHIQDQPPLGDNEGPVGIVLAPARELALQISSEAKKFTKILGMRVACIYGGAGVAEQIADLKRGSDIVVCTPGRMIDILCMQAGRLISLRRVTMPQIKMIMQNVRPDRQTVLFSATFPKQIEKLAKTVLKFPLEIIVGERSTVNKDITQFVEQEKCDQLFQDLLKFSYPVDRDHTLNEFKTGVKTVMVATSGTAYTFISLKEEQYAPVMVKVIEKAGQTPVPPELLEMSKQFKSKVAKGEAHWSSSGFVGKGFTFDSNEMNETQKIGLRDRPGHGGGQGPGSKSGAGSSSNLTSALEKAKQLASSLQGGATPTQIVSTGPSGAVKIDANAAMAKARYIAEQMEFISRNPGMQVGLAAGASYFAEELEINDYPFQARRKVTNRQAMDDITERTGVAIISRGVFIEPGKKPQPGERKLSIFGSVGVC
eukprot:gene27042-35752_t